jgi:hypothetical protein
MLARDFGWRAELELSPCVDCTCISHLKLIRRANAFSFPRASRRLQKSTMKTILILLIFAAAPIALQGGSSSSSSPTAPNHCATELRDAMSRMHASMFRLPMAANPDEDFVRLMIPHHQAAVDMAKTQLLCGKDPQIRRLAQEIITDQQSEIQLMELWLKNHATTAPKADISH